MASLFLFLKALQLSSAAVIGFQIFKPLVVSKLLELYTHLNYVAQKCEKAINIIRSLSGVWWGSHPYSQKLLYNALIRSHLDYGSFILDPCNKEGLEKLNLIQARCLRIILAAMKSSPKIALQVECLEAPLDLRR